MASTQRVKLDTDNDNSGKLQQQQTRNSNILPRELRNEDSNVLRRRTNSSDQTGHNVDSPCLEKKPSKYKQIAMDRIRTTMTSTKLVTVTSSSKQPGSLRRRSKQNQKVKCVILTEPEPLPDYLINRPPKQRRISNDVGYQPRNRHRHPHQARRQREFEFYKAGLKPHEIPSDSD